MARLFFQCVFDSNFGSDVGSNIDNLTSCNVCSLLSKEPFHRINLVSNIDWDRKRCCASNSSQQM
jgi:hypothetical protein